MVTVLCAAPLLLASACTAGGAASGAADTGGGKSIVVAFKHEVNTLDPVHADYAMTDMIDDTLYDALVAYDKDNKLVGKLASAFSVAPDGKSVTFTLRDGATFHDGSPVTASDVKYTLDRYARIGQGVASALKSYAGTTVTDPHHLTITLKQPDSFFVGSLQNVYILSQAIVSKHAGSDDGQAWLQANDAGSGPFQANGSPATDGATVARYDKYWDFDPKRPTQITFRRIDESATQRDELKAGNVDIAWGLSANDAQAVQGNGIQVAYLKTAGQTQVVFNTQTGPTANPAVRQAVQDGFDYTGGLSKLLGGHGAVASGLLSDALTCRPDGSAPAGQDIAKAKKVLADAGLSNVKLTLRFQPADAVQTQIATLLQSDLAEAGVTVQLVPVAFPDYLKLLASPATIPQMMLLNDYAKTPDPAQTLNSLYNSSSIGSTNKSAYKNAAVDALLNQARTTTNDAARCDLDKRAQSLISADAPVASLYQVAFPVGYRSGISGVEPDWAVAPMAISGVRVG
jgi:peptide/nickel transport system substrate-binding protein